MLDFGQQNLVLCWGLQHQLGPSKGGGGQPHSQTHKQRLHKYICVRFIDIIPTIKELNSKVLFFLEASSGSIHNKGENLKCHSTKWGCTFQLSIVFN